MMNGPEKSHRPILPAKRQNNAGRKRPAADGVEGRGLTKRNSNQQNTRRTQRRESVPSALDRVRQVARQNKRAKFTALLHHVTLDRLRNAYRKLNSKAAPGIDEVTWKEYGENLEANLEGLHARLHRGAYRAKPSRRAYIPKADGRLRPLGIAALEDKIVQSAVVEVLNAIYEEDFLGFSYGFRPGRSQHQALDALAVGITKKKVNWVLDADVRGFFDSISHKWMVEFVKHRIADKRIVRLIQKWLAAGVIEKDGQLAEVEVGTPQGATVSPLLANVYLHYAFDLWAHDWRQRKAKGDVVIVRFADDFVVGFEHRQEAERFLAELKERFQKFGLEMHPDKTRLIEFGRHAAQTRQRRGEGKPETFTFLGLKHIGGKSKAGRFLLTRQTDPKRLRAKLKEVKTELRRRMHLPIKEQGAWLQSVVRGYFNYHAVPTNRRSIDAFRTEVGRHWFRTLRRRSQRRSLNWERMWKLDKRWLPRARILHPWPDERFRVRTQGKNRMR
jgi:group II intron reverse transcriptase/maturase